MRPRQGGGLSKWLVRRCAQTVHPINSVHHWLGMRQLLDLGILVRGHERLVSLGNVLKLFLSFLPAICKNGVDGD